MIEKCSELLEKFIEIERKVLEKIDMPHMPTLGSAYEEITNQGLEQNFVIPPNLDLRVVSGFISVGDEMLPQQIDGMLVCGEGQQYGRTKEFIYPIDKVLCIFEVKKTLNKSDYKDAFDHLRVIRQKYMEHFESKFENENFEPNIKLARKHFSQMTGKAAPRKYSEIHSLSKSDGILFYSLVQETLAPLSIIHGYGGYSTEYGMRKAFLDILCEKSETSKEGLGVPSLPALTISNNFSIVKGNGMPYMAINDDGHWAVLSSIKGNPARILLEIIWSKIALYCDVDMPWGDDLQQEVIAPLLFAIPMEIEDVVAWKYETYEPQEAVLRKRDEMSEWKPIAINKDISDLVYSMLARGGYVYISEIEEIANDHSVDYGDLLNRITHTQLFELNDDFIRPIASTLHLVTDSNGQDYLDSNTQRLDAWCDKYKIPHRYINLMILE